MELPQSRPFKTQGREPTHDFLSLCSHNSTLQSDPKPTPSSQGSHLKTHDFLQPLECVCGSKEETSKTETTSEPPPPLQHVLPGGIGTYTISSTPYFHSHQRVPKPELSQPMMFSASSGVERNVVDAAAVASGFTLWDESGSGNKGQIRKDNNAVERADVAGQWPVVEHRSQSLTNNNQLSGFSTRSSSQGSGLKSQSFMEMLRSAKGTSKDDEFDDEEDFVMKKESSSTSQNHIVDLRVKGCNDPKLNTPRSKHSATEQRRRSKINDRFQMLRKLIPNSDQKRDKASFLLEVIEYIQFLQEKTSKYETPYQGWNQEPSKQLNWQRHNQQLVPEGTVSFAPKLEEEETKNIPVLTTAETLNRATRPTTGPFPLSVQSSSLFSPVIAGNPGTQLHTRVASPETETAEPSQSSRIHIQPLKEEDGDEEEVHEGKISISSVYSQGLVKRLREALEKSGVDLSKSTISVEIELAKRSSDVCEPVSRTGNDDVKQTRKPKRLKTCNTS